MNLVEAKALAVGEKFRGTEWNGGIPKVGIFVVAGALEGAVWEKYVAAVTEEEFEKGFDRFTHIFPIQDMEAL